MKNNLLKKIFHKEKDEVLEFLKEQNDNFLRKINNYGFKNVEEYLDYNPFVRSRNRYPVNSDC